MKDTPTPDWISADTTKVGRVAKRCAGLLEEGIPAPTIADKMNQNMGYPSAQEILENPEKERGPITSEQVSNFGKLWHLQEGSKPILSSKDVKELRAESKGQKEQTTTDLVPDPSPC